MVDECAPEPVVVSLVWALDEVFIGFTGRPVAEICRRREEACVVWDCRQDADALDAFARLIAGGARVEIDAGTIGVSPDGCACSEPGGLERGGRRCPLAGDQVEHGASTATRRLGGLWRSCGCVSD